MTTTQGEHAQTAAQVQRYKIGYPTDLWGERSSTPSGIPDHAGAWVRYEDHAAQVAALTAAQPVAQAGPDFYTACAWHEGGGESGWIALPGYSNETEHGVKSLVLEAARKEGYKGTAAGRLLELGWEIRPVYLAPAQPAPGVESNTAGAYAELPERPDGSCTVDDGPVPGVPGARSEHEEDGYSAAQMRDFADRTHALRVASHGQAPAGASKFADVIAVQLSEAESDPSDAYMVGLYNGMSMIDANYRNITDWEPMSTVPKPTTTAQAAPAADRTVSHKAEAIPGVQVMNMAFGGCPECGFSGCVARQCTRPGPSAVTNIAAPAAGAVAGPVAPPNAITASVMRDDGGEQPAFCLMVAYRSEKDAMDALAMIAAAPTPPAQAADSVLEDAAQESEYRRGYRHGYEQRDAEVRGALA